MNGTDLSPRTSHNTAPASFIQGLLIQGPFIQGMVAVVLFSLTVPMTQLALADFSAEFIAATRGLLAGVLAWMVILKQGWKWPATNALPWLLVAGAGVVLGFPYLLSLSLTQVPAADMGVVLAGLPLTTALLAAWIHHERHSASFWLLAATGFLLLALYVVLSLGELPSFSVQDSWLLLATLLMGGIGYSAGAKATKLINQPDAGWQTICWTLVLYLPLSALLWGMSWGEQAQQLTRPVALPSLLALVYLALISQLWGFKFWYQALASSSVAKVSQLQLLQPFFTLFFIALLLSQAISGLQLVFCCLVVLNVYASIKVARR